MKTRLLLGVLYGTTAASLLGCAQLPSGLPQELRPIAELVPDLIQQQGVLSDFTANARGHGLEPGMEAYTAVEVTAGVRLSGVDLDIEGRTQGEGVANASDAVRQFVIEQARSGDAKAIELAQKEFGYKFEILPPPEPTPLPNE